MGQGPLVIENIVAGAHFLAEFQNYAPISVAFWIKESDSGAWSLIVASDEITDKNFDLANGEVARIAIATRDPNFDAFQVKVMGSNEPLPKAALELRRLYPGKGPIRHFNLIFGGIAVDEVYIYASPVSVPAC